MNFPKYKPGPVEFWLAEALTQFINGALAGLGTGSAAGVGTGATTMATEVGAKLSSVDHLILSLIAFGAALLGNGLKRFVVWHNDNPFPNPWPKPSSEPQPGKPVL